MSNAPNQFEAVARFNEAIQVKGLPDYRKKQWGKRIQELQGEW